MHTASCRITALLSWLNGSLWQLLRFVSRLTVFITHLKSHSSYLEFLEDCSEQHISRCTLKHLTPAPHWKVTVGDPKLTRKNSFRIRLLTGCDGLEHDAARFRTRSHYGACLVIPRANCAMQKLKTLSTLFPGVQPCRHVATICWH